MVASLALHAGVFAVWQCASSGNTRLPSPPSVHVTLVYGDSVADTGFPVAAHDSLSSQLDAFEVAAAPQPHSTPDASSRARDTIDDLFPAPSAGGGTPSGGTAVAGGGGGMVQDPYARASLAGDAGLTGAAMLREQVMACWLGNASGTPVVVRVELMADGSLRRRPAIVRASAIGTKSVETAAIRAVMECAPYRVSDPTARVYEVAVG